MMESDTDIKRLSNCLKCFDVSEEGNELCEATKSFYEHDHEISIQNSKIFLNDTEWSGILSIEEFFLRDHASNLFRLIEASQTHKERCVIVAHHL